MQVGNNTRYASFVQGDHSQQRDLFVSIGWESIADVVEEEWNRSFEAIQRALS